MINYNYIFLSSFPLLVTGKVEASHSKMTVGERGDILFLIQQKTVTKFIVTVSAWQLVPTGLFALGFLLG
nr:MAG TPA: hypothetical protein [Caudoviricetes sp.]